MGSLAYHVQHFKRGQVTALGAHNWQHRGEHDVHSNQDIISSRSKDNLLLRIPEGSLLQAAKARVKDCHGRITSQSNWISEAILYPPENIAGSTDALAQYFTDVVDWFDGRFGQENVVAAVVHMDETTPHLHLDLVPVTPDGRLSANALFTRATLREQHTELARYLQGRGWEIERGQSSRGKNIHSRTVAEYKRAAEQERQQFEKTAVEASRRAEKAVIEAQALQDSLVGQKALYEALRAINDEMEDLPRSNEMYPPYAKRRKWPLMNQETVTVPVTEWERIVRSMKSYSAMQNAQEKLDKSMKDVQRTPTAQRVEELTRHVEELTEKEEYWMDKYRAAEKELERMRQQGPYAGLTILEQLHPDLWPYIEEAMKVVDMPEYRRYSYISEHTQSRETDQEHENSGPDLGM